MLTAIRIFDNKKVVGEFIEKDENESYKCEVCTNPVIHHRPDERIKVGHFKHKSNQIQCPNHDGMSIKHLTAQFQIYEYIKNNWGNRIKSIELEKWLFNNTIRADIYLETRKNKIAIEVQASTLDIKDIKRRTSQYFQNNVYILWTLIYDYSRFYEFKHEYGHKDDGSWGIIHSGDKRVDRIRLKEFELFLYYAHFKKLIFWDIEQERNKYFTVMELADYWTDSVEFKQDGIEQSYDAKKTKVMKTISSTWREVTFDEFKIRTGEIFQGKNYDLPQRTILDFDTRAKRKL